MKLEIFFLNFTPFICAPGNVVCTNLKINLKDVALKIKDYFFLLFFSEKAFGWNESLSFTGAILYHSHLNGWNMNAKFLQKKKCNTFDEWEIFQNFACSLLWKTDGCCLILRIGGYYLLHFSSLVNQSNTAGDL